MAQRNVNQRRWCSAHPLLVALVVAALPALAVIPRVVAWTAAMRGQAPSWLRGDLDTQLIHDGLMQAPEFADTFRWWAGTWVGQVPFYRPLTSCLFWIEWKLFGDREYLYLIPTVVAHVAATVLFATFAYRLAERWRVPRPWLVAIVAGWSFTGFGLPYRDGIVWAVVSLWKNQPDAFASICCFLALIAYLGTRPRAHTWPWAAAAWYLAACCFKEIAIGLPLVCGMLDPGNRSSGERPRVSRQAVFMAGAGTLFLLVRFTAIRGIGYTYGSNDRWLERTLLEALGPFASPLVYHEWGTVAMGLFVCALAAYWWRRRGKVPGRRVVWLHAGTLLALAAGTIAIRVFYLQALVPIVAEPGAVYLRTVEALMFWEDSTFTQAATAVALIVAATTLLWRQCRGAIGLSLVWTAVSVAPVALSPGPIHRYYLSEGGYALAGALAAAWMVEVAHRYVSARLTTAEPEV